MSPGFVSVMLLTCVANPILLHLIAMYGLISVPVSVLVNGNVTAWANVVIFVEHLTVDTRQRGVYTVQYGIS